MKFVPVLVFVAITGSLSAQSGAGLFETSSPAVVYIQQAVKILPQYFADVRTLTQLEHAADRSILNGYLPIESGSGFFVDRLGHIVTNNHVVDVSGLKKTRENAAQYWGKYIDDTFKDKDMAPEDRRVLKVALFKAITQGPFALQALVGNKDIYEVQVVAASLKPDLAVLKIEVEGNPALPLAPSDSLKVGDDLYSIGYPFGSDVVRKLQEISATFTKGAVSAFREEKWIQHTATINPGNSGGPLLDASGRVVGVNTALRTNANNTYFAIPISTVRGFCAANNLAALVPEPVTGLVEAPGGPSLHQNSLGEFEVSSDVIFNQEKGARVFVDGKPVGVTPLFFNPDSSAFDVRIEGATGTAEGRLRVLKSLSGSTDVFLPWKSYTAKVTITTTEPGAKLLLDGKPLGDSPLTGELPVGPHIFSAQAVHWVYQPLTVTLVRDQEQTLKLEGEQQIPVGFRGRGDRPVLTATQGDRSVTVQPTDDFALPSGSWTVSWDATAAYEPGSVRLEIGETPSMVDALPFVAHGALAFPNLSPQAVVYLDGDQLGPSRSAPFTVEVGSHNVTVLERGFQPFAGKVDVAKGATAEVVVTRPVSAGAWGLPALWTGAGIGVMGVALTVYGIHQYGDSVALSQTSSYRQYTSWKTTARSEYIVGMTAAGTGAVLALIGWMLNANMDDDIKHKESR
jgi:S1-C subfamily serine protease